LLSGLLLSGLLLSGLLLSGLLLSGLLLSGLLLSGLLFASLLFASLLVAGLLLLSSAGGHLLALERGDRSLATGPVGRLDLCTRAVRRQAFGLRDLGGDLHSLPILLRTEPVASHMRESLLG